MFRENFRAPIISQTRDSVEHDLGFPRRLQAKRPIISQTRDSVEHAEALKDLPTGHPDHFSDARQR